MLLVNFILDFWNIETLPINFYFLYFYEKLFFHFICSESISWFTIKFNQYVLIKIDLDNNILWNLF